ncbi:MAG: DUF559 domain-containing protein [Bacteroidetes bacterium]|nr:DUF559 domain-containing protein [Bacteroidota bacterium]
MKDRFLPYNKDLKTFSRELRNQSTLSEILLWMKLRGRGYRGHQFLRQKPIDNYIADIYCKKLCLVIEVDGASHSTAEAVEYDKRRDEIMAGHGLTVMRIMDIQVKRKMWWVLEQIDQVIDEWEKANPPAPPVKGGVSTMGDIK